MTLINHLIKSVQAAAKVNATVQTPPAAILWTDKERHWETVAAGLQCRMPGLLTLGAFGGAPRTGPAIWLKCAIAGVLEDIDFAGQTPVIYLPGISRADLRAIETCPRELQPLAELQYRGAFWSQTNGKDWTVNAFLSAKKGGLGLDVAQDHATQEALKRIVESGLLLDRTVEEFQGKQINAAWLDSLLAPNPTRDVLAWLNDPVLTQSQWAGARWSIFSNRCTKDFGFNPQTDGVLTAAEKLAEHQGAWLPVWELYRESFASFKAVAGLLAKLQPPQPMDMFDAPDQLAGYPRANEEAEAALRCTLSACAAMAPEQARAKVLEADHEHGNRRDWLWAKMGSAPLVQGLQHLADLATLSRQVPGGATLAQMAANYQASGWKVDQAAMFALAAVTTKADTDAIGAALRALYLPWLEDSAHRFQELVKAVSGLEHVAAAATAAGALDGVCTVFVDGLRYDVAMQLKERLAALGKVTASAQWTSMPSVTASGKAWASPVAQWVSGKKTDEDFQPSVAADGKPLSTHNFRKLLADHGFQVLDKHESGEPGAPHAKAWAECGDLDHYGHAHGIRLARDMSAQLDQIVERLTELNEAGWMRFRIVTDHGWLLMPGGLPKTELSMFEAQTRWGRCAVLKDSSHGTPLTFGWDWCKEVQIAFAPGISNFTAGEDYTHGGLTLQECLVPVLELAAAGESASTVKADIIKVAWTGLRCKVEVSSAATGLRVDIRTKAALADSTLVAYVKALENGKASLAIDDDASEGMAAFVVVLDAAGHVRQRKSTTVGE
ncbi:MAG: BREX-1 system phosphatase PglZ type B [Comamonadaceae bacterium]|nr:BREX-1 system phosphatase PglZ type B [Comamonadaceae bacterium]